MIKIRLHKSTNILEQSIWYGYHADSRLQFIPPNGSAVKQYQKFLCTSTPISFRIWMLEKSQTLYMQSLWTGFLTETQLWLIWMGFEKLHILHTVISEALIQVMLFIPVHTCDSRTRMVSKEMYILLNNSIRASFPRTRFQILHMPSQKIG